MTIFDPPVWVETNPDSYQPYTLKGKLGPGSVEIALPPIDLYALEHLHRETGTLIAIAKERER